MGANEPIIAAEGLWNLPVTSIKGIKVGRMSSPKTFERTSNPAALHFRKFQTFTASSSSSCAYC
jgi:hypothetical protein